MTNTTRHDEAVLEMFRAIAADMTGKPDWEWVGRHMSQRMFGISQERAEDYAKVYGGVARKMEGR